MFGICKIPSPVSGPMKSRSGNDLPFPKKIPGRFIVVSYSRDGGSYSMILDDEERSSYNLGSDIQKVMALFRGWGLEDVGFRTVDLAREFGAAQGILADGRVIALSPKTKDRTVSSLLAEKESAHDNRRSQFAHL
jgi:hypothetical protein